MVLIFSVGTAYAHDPTVEKSKGVGLQGLKRTVLSKTDITGVSGKEAVVLTVDGAPGLVGKKHYHPGDEFLYVQEGSLTLHVDGRAPVTLKVGETLHIPARVVHQPINPSPTHPFKVVTFGVFEKGQPDTTVVGE
jgi:quercetin dioxygenase-like cupin family protein